MTTIPEQSPFYHALEADRYDRQAAIRDYETHSDRTLIVLAGQLDNQVIPPFADVIQDAPPDQPLDLMLDSPGGDAEAALRIAKMCHSSRDDFRVIVPNQAKSAATMLALAAEKIVMSDTSDLGPVDPQILLSQRGQFVAAGTVVEVVEDLEKRVSTNPGSYEWYAALLGDIDAVAYQHARQANDRTNALVGEFLKCRTNPPNENEAGHLAKELQDYEVHSAVVGHAAAHSLGLPVVYLPPSDTTWQLLWRLYVKYAVLAGRIHPSSVIEGRRVSLVAVSQP